MKRRITLLVSFFLAFFANTAAAQYDLVVAADGSGDYRTVQAAINAASPGTASSHFRIFIKNGRYYEKDTVHAAKVYLDLVGESVGGVTITFDAAANAINPQTNVAWGTSGSATLTINAENFTAWNITFENTTGRIGDGPQAVAVNAGKDKIAFKNCRFIGGQDTLLTNGNGNRQYFSGCYIDGNTDFIFGSAVALFDSCVIYGRDRVDGQSGGIITAANTPPGQTYGYVFRNCRIPASRVTTSYSLGRPWGNSGTPNTNPTHNKVVFLNTRMGNSVKAAGWDVWDAGTNTSVITYAEFNSQWFNGSPKDVSQRLGWTQQLSSTAAAVYNLTNIFTNASGTWNPHAAIPGFSTAIPEQIAVANVRVKRALPQLGVSWNACWPMTGITYELFRSFDRVNFTQVYSDVAVTDTSVAYYVPVSLTPGRSQYYFYVKASKAGYTSYISDTIAFNAALPLNGDFRSVVNGPWGNGATWEKYDAASATWIQQSGTGSSAYPGGASDVRIQSGDTVTMTGTSYVNSITIDPAAVLNSDASNRTLRLGTGIINDGVFGGPSTASNNITLEFISSNTNVTLTGSGLYHFNRLRPLTGLVNASLTIDANVALTGTLGAWYNNGNVTPTEKVAIIINAGDTVTIGAGGALHNANPANANPGGIYDYVVNGVLDLSATTGVTALVPAPAAGSAINVRVGQGGLLRFGPQLTTQNTASGTFSGKIRFLASDSGHIDFSAIPAASLNTGTWPWEVSGNGQYSRMLDSGSTISLPLRIAGQTQNSDIDLTRVSQSGPIRAGIVDTVSGLVSGHGRYVRRQWNLRSSDTSLSADSLSLFWTASEQTSAFDPNQAYMARNTGTGWDSLTTQTSTRAAVSTAVTGAAKLNGSFAVLNYFMVQVPNGVQPVTAQHIQAYPNPVEAALMLRWSPRTTAGQLRIIDQLGRELLQRSIAANASDLRLDCAAWPAGIYFAELIYGADRATVRFVKR